MHSRRNFLRAAAAVVGSTVALGAASRVSAQQQKVIKVGTLKLIHGITPYFYEKFAPAGYKVDVIPFESPTDGKNAVVTGTVDFGTFGIAAATLGAAAGEPLVIFAAQCNRGMAIVSSAKSDIKTVKDLKGKKVAIWPGSTQEVVILERLKAEGMTIKDIQPIRLPFSDMAPALARGDVDAYVGAEPGPGISLANGDGKILEYPYSTPIGSLNMVWGVKQDTIDKNPELVKVMMDMHRKATDFAMSNENARIPSLQHRFQLTEAGEQKLVDYRGQWNGKYASQSVGGPTEVNLTVLAYNLKRVCNLVGVPELVRAVS